MCAQNRPAFFDETSKKTGRQKQEIARLDVSAEELYRTCLQTLKAKFQDEGKALFYQSFENAYEQIYYKRRENKRRYWSKTALILLILGGSGSGAVTAASLFSLVSALLPAGAESCVPPLTAIARTCGPLLLIFLLALGLLAACLIAEFERRNYKGTWVRHSVAYHRLNIAMIRFLSNLTGEEDFMKEVLRILEADIESFELSAGVSSESRRQVKTDG